MKYFASTHHHNLKNIDLRNQNLRFSDFRGCDLRKANLQNADCTGVDFRGALLQDADFRGANIDGLNPHLLRSMGAILDSPPPPERPPRTHTFDSLCRVFQLLPHGYMGRVDMVTSMIEMALKKKAANHLGFHPDSNHNLWVSTEWMISLLRGIISLLHHCKPKEAYQDLCFCRDESPPLPLPTEIATFASALPTICNHLEKAIEKGMFCWASLIQDNIDWPLVAHHSRAYLLGCALGKWYNTSSETTQEWPLHNIAAEIPELQLEYTR